MNLRKTRAFTLIELPVVSFCKRSAFTLIELLVVIAVIAILVSLLVPIVGKAMRRGRSIQCVSNLRQIGVAIRLYSADYGRYPLGYADDNSEFPADKQGDWTYWLNEYLGGVRMTNNLGGNANNRSSVIMCPSQVSGRGLVLNGYSAHPSILVDPAWNPPTDGSPSWQYSPEGVPYRPFKRPSDIVMMLDGLLPSETEPAYATFMNIAPFATDNAWKGDVTKAETPINLPFADHNGEVGRVGGWSDWRHDGTINTLRVDGHVESLKLVGKDGTCEFKEKHVALNY